MLRNKNYVYGTGALMVPGHVNFGRYMLDKCREFNGDIAMIDADTGETMTHSQLVKLSVDIALSLVRMGVKRGDAVCVFSENRLEFMPTLLGTICTAATFLAGDVNQRFERVLNRLNIVKPKIIFCSQNAYGIHKDTLKKATCVENIIIYGNTENENMSFKDFLSLHDDMQNYEDFQPIPVKGWSDIALILFTTGTTGLPKAAPMTHLNFISFYQSSFRESIPSRKPLLSTCWFRYSYGLIHSVAALLMGAPLIITTRNNVEDYMSIVEKYKVSTLQVIPTTLKKLVKTPTLDIYDVSSMEVVVTATMPVDSKLLEATRSSFQNLRDIIRLYGMTEAGCVILQRGLCQKMNSVGTVLAGTVFKVVDINSRKPLGPNERGEICFKSITLMSGYIGDTTLEYMDDEGFFKTGDIGYYDDDKYFYIVDRVKDMFNYSGFMLSPVELESILLQHPKVKEAGIVAVPQELLGEVPVAFVVLKPGEDVSETELKDYFVECAPTIQLEGVRFVTSLPRGAGDKLDRSTLKSMINKSTTL